MPMYFCVLVGGIRILHSMQLVTALKWTNHYHKPKPSNGPCINIIERIEMIVVDRNGTNPSLCIGCSLSQATCPSSCQGYIDDLYRKCDGVTLPENYYFDPPVSNSDQQACYVSLIIVKSHLTFYPLFFFK